MFEISKEFANTCDQEDPLKDFRNKFYIPHLNGKEVIYLCGNSLGLQPKAAKSFIEQELSCWAQHAVEGHLSAKNPWINYHKYLEEIIAEIAGARIDEVVVANSLTVNLHLMLTSFYQPKGKRKKILVENSPFSSDWYALESHAKLHGFTPEEVIIEMDATDHYTSTEQILQKIDAQNEELALVLLGGVNYFTGQAFEMEKIIAHAHKYQIPVGIDLAHAIGNIPLKLHDWNCDFAVWCSYKYLNAGPGSTGGYFIHQKHATNKNHPRLAGWWGHSHEKRFLMEKGFDPIPTAEGWQLSNAPVISMAVQWSSLELFRQAKIEKLREKSIRLTGYLQFLIQEIINKNNKNSFVKIITPLEKDERGCQLSLKIKDAKNIYQKLKAEGFIIDFRSPDVIRVSPVPLYNKFSEVYHFVNALNSLL